MVMRVTCVSIKQRFANLKRSITLVGTFFFFEKNYKSLKKKINILKFLEMIMCVIFQLTIVQLKKEDIFNIHQYLMIKQNWIYYKNIYRIIKF